MALPSPASGRTVSVLFVVVAVLLAGCGGGLGSTDDADADRSTSIGIDSSPGQTEPEADETAATAPSTTTAGAGSVTAETGAADGAATTAEPVSESPLVVTGAGVAAATGFSDFSGQRIGLIASRASVVGGESTIDLMAGAGGVDLVAIFTPEHGLRAEGGAGELFEDGVDPVTGLPVHSLYGGTREPTAEMLEGIDVLIFDLQDVGTRFYTYTATMGLAMRRAAERGIPFVVFDRPNPIGGTTVGGAVRDGENVSFVSQYPIPAQHGMTAGELATAIVGEGWLSGVDDLDLRVVPVAGWDRAMRWEDTALSWVPPSPGLPTSTAALVYPATVLFEATEVSFGQGTDLPFQQIGAPSIDAGALLADLEARALPGVGFEEVVFTPEASRSAPEPRFEAETVPGVRIDVVDADALDQASLALHLIDAVLDQAGGDRSSMIDRPEFFDLLAGTASTRRDLQADIEPDRIAAGWQADLEAFATVRARYLQY